jgi:hypothetical protein
VNLFFYYYKKAEISGRVAPDEPQCGLPPKSTSPPATTVPPLPSTAGALAGRRAARPPRRGPACGKWYPMTLLNTHKKSTRLVWSLANAVFHLLGGKSPKLGKSAEQHYEPKKIIARVGGQVRGALLRERERTETQEDHKAIS